MTYYLVKWLMSIVNHLPKSAANALGSFLGWATWQLVPAKRKQAAKENIILTLGKTPAEAERIAKASWTRFGPMLVEVMRFAHIKAHLNDYIEIEGRQHLDKALSYGHGAVMAAAHMGNWELLGGALALSGYPLIAVAQRQANESMNRLINEHRAMMGMHVTPKSSVMEMVKYLGKGYLIGLLMDQDARDDGLIVDFLGQKASCYQGPAYLARLKGAPIVPVFITRLPDGRHKVMLHESFFVEKTKDRQADIRRATLKIVEIVESHIRSRPEEWFWMHDRWKYCKRPEVRAKLLEMESRKCEEQGKEQKNVKPRT